MTVEAEQALVSDGDSVGIAAVIQQYASGVTEGRLGIDHLVVLEQRTHEGCGWSQNEFRVAHS